MALLLSVPVGVSEARRAARQETILLDPPSQEPGGSRAPAGEPVRDRMEEAGREFFDRVDKGYQAIAAAEPDRVSVIDSTQPLETVRAAIWRRVEPLIC